MAETDLQQLHDRASRGLPLSEAERQSLIDWYARQDRLEDDLLSQRQGSPLPALRAQIDQSVSQMRHAVERIQVLTPRTKSCTERSKPCKVDWLGKSQRHAHDYLA